MKGQASGRDPIPINNKMSVLMVIAQFYPSIGGAEKQAQLLAKTIAEKGVHVRIVTGWWTFNTPRKETIDGVEVLRNFSCWGMGGIKHLRNLGGFIYMVSLITYLLLHRKKYHLIHVHQMLYPAFISVLVGSKLLRKPVVVKTASSGVTSDISQLRRYLLGEFQLRYLLRNTKCLVAVNRNSGRDFLAIGYPESRIEYIPNGVMIPPERSKKDHGRVSRVITTARLSREKGVDVLLRAWVHVLEQEGDLRLSILGTGPLESELKTLCHSLGLSAKVDFMGLTYNVGEFLQEADLFVLPSRTEGLSNALLEAMSHGVPCIATCVGGNEELLESWEEPIRPGAYTIGKGGLLVNSEDVEGLAQAILFLVRNQERREEMGRRGRAYVQEHYSIDRVADRYIALYQELLNRRC